MRAPGGRPRQAVSAVSSAVIPAERGDARRVKDALDRAAQRTRIRGTGDVRRVSAWIGGVRLG
jgi:hypothetical protein